MHFAWDLFRTKGLEKGRYYLVFKDLRSQRVTPFYREGSSGCQAKLAPTAQNYLRKAPAPHLHQTMDAALKAKLRVHRLTIDPDRTLPDQAAGLTRRGGKADIA